MSGTRLDLTIANAEVRDLTQNLAQKDARKQAEIFAALIARLKAAGAQAAAVTSMGVPSASASFCRYRHCRCSMASQRSTPPSGGGSSRQLASSARAWWWRRDSAERSRRLRWWSFPGGAELDEVHQNYAAMATAGRVSDAQRRVFFAAGERLCRDQGAEVVLLGGTDLFLAFRGYDAGYPVLDCADVHVEAIYQASLRAG